MKMKETLPVSSDVSNDDSSSATDHTQTHTDHTQTRRH